MIAPPSMALLESVFNHLVLPPKLPGQQDPDIEGVTHNILTRLIRACDTLGNLSGQTLNQLLILHVAEQNAAILIRRHVSDRLDTVIVEAFEASPTSEDVLAAGNALLWDFPGRAAEIPSDEFLTEAFQQSLAAFLEQASMESLERFEARSVKANFSVIEARNTTHPALITQMLMPLLEALGACASVPRLRKRVRDDVNIQNAELPWRRLPFWLVIRVATRRQLSLLLGNDTGRACYKFLICIVLAQFLDDCVGQLAPELIVTLRAKLCRRLAKLEMDKVRVGSSASAAYNEFFGSTGPLLKRVIETATVRVEAAWADFKRTITRPVPKLPSRADRQHLRLSLPNSGKYLDDLLRLRPVQRTGNLSLYLSGVGDDSVEQVQNFTDRYFKLARMESTIKEGRQSAPDMLEDCQTRCLELANSITDLFTAVGSAYDFNPEQMSIFILNLFELAPGRFAAADLIRNATPPTHPELSPGEMCELSAYPQEYFQPT
ncbi:hypothetical protein DL769_009768 [Monosporascus sp. CRB-8-3]|nr:hypothetical protein DL769_009768 [Monosporascus sp. CRB-8-3]